MGSGWIKHVWAAAALALLLAACSVSTPRDGFVAAGGGPAATGAGGTRSSTAATGTASSGAGTGAAGDAVVGADGAVAAGSSDPAAASAAGGSGAAPEQGGAPGSSGVSTAPPGGTTVGVTDDSVVVSVIAGFSGPYGVLFRAIADNGYGLWADEVNDHGGIHGRRVVLRQVDHRDTAEGGVAACKEVEENGSFLVISLEGLGGADISAAECLNEAGIPMIASNLAGYRDSWEYVISAFDAGTQAAPLATFVANVIGDSSGKVGLIVNNDPIHFTGRDALKAQLEQLGIPVVREETISPGQGSFVAELSRIRSAGATTLVMLTGNESIGIVRDAKAMGYNPHFTGVFWTLDEFSQAAAELWRGIQAIRGWPTTDSGAYRTYVDTANHYGRTGLVNSTVMAVYGFGKLVGDIIAAAGPSPTREAISPAAQGLGAYDNGILAVTFHQGTGVADVAMYPIVCCNGDNTWQGLGPSRLRF